MNWQKIMIYVAKIAKNLPRDLENIIGYLATPFRKEASPPLRFGFTGLGFRFNPQKALKTNTFLNFEQRKTRNKQFQDLLQYFLRGYFPKTFFFFFFFFFFLLLWLSRREKWLV